MEDNSNSPSSSTPAPAVFQALNEKEGKKVPSPIVNSSLSRSNESTIVFGGEELSLTTCRGSEEDLANAETVLQTPNRPEGEYCSDPDYDRIEERGNVDSAVAYRTRSHDTEEILNNLRKQLNSDIYVEEGKIETFKKATKKDSGLYEYEDGEGDYSVLLD